MSIRFFAPLLTLCLLISSFALAGTLSPELTAQLTAKSPNELVKVWIAVPKPANREPQLRAAQSATLSEQHRNVITLLKDEQQSSQSAIKLALDSLVTAGKASHVKQHWIASVIEAELAASDLNRLAARADIETIYPAPQISLIAPVDSSAASPTNPGAYTTNLLRINADNAHAAGYRGKGRIICSFDTGVDGMHPALRRHWRGYNGTSADSAASWYDPVTHHNSPTAGISSLSPDHGTHVMGIMVGWDSANTGNIYGVAPDAKWISAACIDITGASILDAFEWAADPDGDPNTISDMPDVINHSWGYQANANYNVDCINLFWDAVDNTEALGIVNIFAAGNRGPTAQTIYNPATRGNDSLDCFAVGNLSLSDSMASSSSRGPSQCNGAVKPNVVAPGTSILSSLPGTSYGTKDGTSMAAPHVSGLVALLRQKNPNATVAQIKRAILTTTNHLGKTLPNNLYGWGMIDCTAALNALPANPSIVNLRLYDFKHTAITPGATVAGIIRVLNSGTGTANNVTATITGSNPSLTPLDLSATLGSINPGAVKNAGDSVKMRVSDTVTVGSVLSVPLLIAADGNYSTSTTLYFLVEPRSQEATATHNTGRIQFSLSNFGVMGMASGSFIPLGGAGFNFDNSGNSFFEAGLMAATGPTSVVSGVHGYIWAYDNDFKVAPGGNMQFLSPGPITDQQTYCIFTDSSSQSPIGLRFVQESFSDIAPDNDFIILRYIVTNLSGVMQSNLRVGLFLDWDLANGLTNAGGFNLTDSILGTANNTGTDSTPILSDFRVARILDGPLSSGYTQQGSYVYPQGGGFTPAEKYAFMTDGTASAATWSSARRELVQTLAAGPIPLAANQTDTVAFALAAGADYTTAANAIYRAKTLYDSVVHGPWTDIPDEPSALPRTFALHQNYPNPFNPGTDISFDLPRAADYKLEIFDLLGRRIEEQSGHAAAGRVRLYWNAAGAASGVYLYRVTAGNFSASRKMMLLK